VFWNHRFRGKRAWPGDYNYEFEFAAQLPTDRQNEIFHCQSLVETSFPPSKIRKLPPRAAWSNHADHLRTSFIQSPAVGHLLRRVAETPPVSWDPIFSPDFFPSFSSFLSCPPSQPSGPRKLFGGGRPTVVDSLKRGTPTARFCELQSVVRGLETFYGRVVETITQTPFRGSLFPATTPGPPAAFARSPCAGDVEGLGDAMAGGAFFSGWATSVTLAAWCARGLFPHRSSG